MKDEKPDEGAPASRRERAADKPGSREPRRREASPKHAAEQDAPEPERPTRPDEELGEDIQHMDDPPQAEGPRE